MLRTARHSSDDRSSGYDMLLDEDEWKRELRNGIEGMDARSAVGRRSRGYSWFTRGRVRLFSVYKKVVKKGENRMDGDFVVGHEARVLREYICVEFGFRKQWN